MKGPDNLLRKARTSKFYKWVLNNAMWRVIPFNAPHKFAVEEIYDDGMMITLPYRRKNLNHIKGLHACAMATVSEYVTGFTLLMLLGSSKYRIIMKDLHMVYHYQGKMDAYAKFRITNEKLESDILKPIEENGSAEINCEVKVYDTDKNHLSTGNVIWHLKPWTSVKTRL